MLFHVVGIRVAISLTPLLILGDMLWEVIDAVQTQNTKTPECRWVDRARCRLRGAMLDPDLAHRLQY